VETPVKKNPKDKESGLTKAYVSGLSASTAKARAAHWKKTSKMDPKNPAAYEPAPGDKTAKTKESKHTKAYRAKFGEEAEIDEAAAAGLAKKAKASGVSIGTLRKVYNRGVAAWRTGHRPGTTPQQWGMARVNSYVTKGKGTYHGADKDLRESLWANIHAKRKRIAAGSGERMRKPGEKGAPTSDAIRSAKESIDPNKPSSREDGTSSLAKVYKRATPGQSKAYDVVKSVIREALGDCSCGGNCKCGDTKKVNEAEYQGRKVALGKPMKGDVKKSKVYVKNEKGNVVKVEFGDPNMTIKKHIPGRRKNFRARHNCDNPGPRTKARYWSCRAW
jgi:hypothetical protein